MTCHVIRGYMNRTKEGVVQQSRASEHFRSAVSLSMAEITYRKRLIFQHETRSHQETLHDLRDCFTVCNIETYYTRLCCVKEVLIIILHW